MYGKKWWKYDTSIIIVLTLIAILLFGIVLFRAKNNGGYQITERLDTPISQNPNIISVSTTDAPIQASLVQPVNDNPISSNPSPSTTLLPPVPASSSGDKPITPGTSVYAELPVSADDAAVQETPISTAGKCLPADGEGWSKPGGYQGTVLNSPCCQPPDYSILDETLATCDNRVGASSAVSTCLLNCCQQVNADRGKYDASWYPMAKCGCALACNYMNENHFAKHGTAWRYIIGQPGDVKANESRGVAIGGNWRGIIPAFK